MIPSDTLLSPLPSGKEQGESPNPARIVVISVNGKLTMKVDPMTRKATEVPQQFRLNGRKLENLPLSEYVADPVRLEVSGWRY